MKKSNFVFLDHMSDAYIESYGKTLEEAFQSAALAFFETMMDTNRIRHLVVDKFKVQGHDEKELLYNWLEALLVRFETDHIAYSRFHVEPILKARDGLGLSATARGEGFDRERHAPKVAVKAITYHAMEIIPEKGKYTVRFLLDL